jgi:hypothetical protein
VRSIGIDRFRDDFAVQASFTFQSFSFLVLSITHHGENENDYENENENENEPDLGSFGCGSRAVKVPGLRRRRRFPLE